MKMLGDRYRHATYYNRLTVAGNMLFMLLTSVTLNDLQPPKRGFY